MESEYENGVEYYVCSRCGMFMRADQFDGDLLFEEEFDNIVYEDEPGVGCTACDNPAFPDCKTSCPAFDD